MSSVVYKWSAALLVFLNFTASAAVHYVSANSADPTPPFITWASAATTIQDAVDAALDGDEIVVTNGVYATGGRAVYGLMTNRVAIGKAVTVRSLNGPIDTIIQGYQTPDIAFDNSVRCVYLTNGAVLSGFTLTNGGTLCWGDSEQERSGAGLWCASTNALVTNCVVTGNGAWDFGGGSFGGTLQDCSLIGNWASHGGGAHGATLERCSLTSNSAQVGGGAEECSLFQCQLQGNSALTGAGASESTLERCTLVANWANEYGGGALGGTLHKCTLTENRAKWGGGACRSTLSQCLLTGNTAEDGGGVYESTLNNCTLAGNTARLDGGGAYQSTLCNCIVYFNAGISANYYSGTMNHCCTRPLPPGSGNITNEPAFTDFASGSLRLHSGSPCINSGDNSCVTDSADLDGSPRFFDDMVDMGAYEFQGPFRYVNAANATPVPPYDSWASAATTIQDAVDAAEAGEVVLVTNGVYATGGRAVYKAMTNRLAIQKAVSVRSVNGPAFTIIEGYQAPRNNLNAGNTSIRCVYLTNGAVLSGFTLTNGGTGESGDAEKVAFGGGLWCASPEAIATNCVLAANQASSYGGGAFGGTLNRCILTGNGTSGYGGGAFLSTLNHCTLSGNWASNSGGGAIQCTLNNCRLTGNWAAAGGGADWATLNNCTLTDNQAPGGSGALRSTLTNCIVYYNIGGANCEQSTVTFSCTTPLPATGMGNITNPPVFVDQTGGNLRLDGNSPCINAGSNSYATNGPDLDGNPRISGGTIDMGAYEFQNGLRYVNANSSSPTPPYNSWAAAAATIQDAVDAAGSGDEIVVSNGVYATGGRAVYGLMTNRVAVEKALRVRSLNGPEVTIIQGYQVPGATNGDGAIRCVYLANGAILSGFTLTSGATRTVESTDYYSDFEASGGGLWAEPTALLSNCVLVGNSAFYYGGGAYRGTLNNCSLRNNTAFIGGGACESTMGNCSLTGNSAGFGGGVAGGMLNNCTLTGNSAWRWGGGSYYATLNNCINYYNTAPGGENFYGFEYSIAINYSCTTPLPESGIGTITNAPLFVDRLGGDLRLQPTSPCINAGRNRYAPGDADLDGNPRLIGGTVDMGAYEFQFPASLLSYAWLQQYRLPTDGSADSADLDGDGLNNWQEWQSGTDPANASSALRLLLSRATNSNVLLNWRSVPGKSYFLERSTNLFSTPPFQPLATNLFGQTGSTSYTDTNPPQQGPLFYRIGVGE